MPRAAGSTASPVTSRKASGPEEFSVLNTRTCIGSGRPWLVMPTLISQRASQGGITKYWISPYPPTTAIPSTKARSTASRICG